MPAARISVGFVVNPSISGFAQSATIPSMSAPSAKIRTFSSSAVVIAHLHFGVEDPGDGLDEGCHDYIGARATPFKVFVVHEHGAGAGGAARVDVPPAVPDHDG